MRQSYRKSLILWSGFLASLICFLPPVAKSDLVDEVEDLDRQTRPDKQPPPVSSPAEDNGEKNKALIDGKTDPGETAPASQLRPRKPARARQDRPPVLFESRSLQGLKDQGRVILKDEVVITQGDFRIDADEATIIFDNKSRDVTKVLANGRVKISRSASEAKDRVRAECNEAIFYNAERKVLLRGNAKLWRSEDLVRGKQITYELDSGWIKADRVEGVVQPAGQKPTPPSRQGGVKK